MNIRGLLIAIAGVILAYAGTWYYLAHEAEAELERFSDAARAHGIAVRYGEVSVGGFPYRIEVALDLLHVEASQGGKRARLKSPSATLVTQPWDLTHLILLLEQAQIAVAGGPTLDFANLRASIILSDGTPSRLSVESESGTYQSPASAYSFGPMQFHTRAAIWEAATTNTPGLREAKAGEFLLRLRDLTFTRGASPVLAGTAGQFELEGTLRGARTPWPNRASLGEWRDAGGTLELSSIRLVRGDLSITGDASLTLDRRFRPLGAVTLHLNAADILLRHYRETGRMAEWEAQSIREFLAMMGTGASQSGDTLSFTLQDGQILMGPAVIGKLEPLVSK